MCILIVYTGSCLRHVRAPVFMLVFMLAARVHVCVAHVSVLDCVSI